MTFTLTHDPRWLGAPRLELSELVTAGIHQINTEVPGETRVTFSLPATTLPPGLRSLGTARFRVRSVPSDLETPIGLAAPDVSAAGGGQLPFGTFVAGAGVRIAPRTHTGDINTNDRLDTGDAFLMQRLLAGLDEVRAWDHALNDLNGSSVLDSGDVTRVLRAVVGIDPQPGARGMDARDGEPGGKSAHPATRLAFVGGIHHGSAGGTVTVQVRVDEIGYAPSGASFQLDYPAEALRLTGASSHRAGALVPDSALVLWNVTPDGDDDADQTGRLGFVASSATPWPGAEAGGVLAELTFEIQPAAAAQPSWDLRLHAAELPSSDGYSVLALPEAATVFVGQASAFDPWLASFLTEQQRSDPAFTGLDSDGDRDGRVALVEFGTGSHPMASDAPRGPRPRIISIGGERFGAVEFDRSLTALGISHTVQMTDGLGEWRDADDSDTVLHSRSHPPGAAHETLVVRERTPIGEGARARAFRIRFQLDGD